MKIIIINDDEKVNFVDLNNVFVGYDLFQECCERAGWFISNIEQINPIEGNGIIDKLEDYFFDKEYFSETISEHKNDLEKEISMIKFKLTAENKQDLYLHIYNCHNGYYSHGFEVIINGVKIKQGSL